MTNLAGFEGRLLQALTDIDARRPVTQPVLTSFQLRRRRTRGRLALVAAAATVICSTTAVAAASGLFSAAPAGVKRVFAALNGSSGHRVDAGEAVQIGVIDDHAAYAAPTADGGFCLYFAPNPGSGPTGGLCIPRGARPNEVVFNVLPGSDGGFIFGRAGAADASTVAITFPHGAGSLRTPVGEAGFFVARIPYPAMRTLMIEIQPGPKDPPTKDGGPIESFDPTRVSAISVSAADAQGNTVAHGVTSPDWIPTP
jgi:hypothetical protein